MSILILGKTKCPICNKIIDDKNGCYMFPPFVTNVRDPLYFFSDGSFHISCLIDVKDGKKAIEYSEIFISKTRPASRICVVTGELIANQEDHIIIEYLTSNEHSALYRFNFIHINKLNVPNWIERKYVVKELTKLYNSGFWKEDNSNYLVNLIDSLSRVS